MDRYLSYSEYQAYGGTLTEAEFNLAEFRAQKDIDYLTDSRVAAMAIVPEEVKLCIMTLIAVDSKMGADALASSPALASYSTDGYSESYGSASDQQKALKQATDQRIRTMLYGVVDDEGVPLLYRGLI